MKNDLKVNLKGKISNSISQLEEDGARYLSFDYCYNHFHPTNLKQAEQDIEKSCLMIGFYLASWGMLRGSSFLLWKNAKHYEKLINYILKTRRDFTFDVDEYTEDNIKSIVDLYSEVKTLIQVEERAHLTLVTKILLGVYGVVPAFDQNFINGFSNMFGGRCGFRVVNLHSLHCIKEFYDSNIEEINEIASRAFTKDFISSQKTTIIYPKIKIIDMYGFEMGNQK